MKVVKNRNIRSSILCLIGNIIPAGWNMGRLDEIPSYFSRQKMNVHFLAAIESGNA